MLTLSTVNNVEENLPTKAELTKTIWISMRVIADWGESISEVVLEYKISRYLKPSYFKTQHFTVVITSIYRQSAVNRQGFLAVEN